MTIAEAAAEPCVHLQVNPSLLLSSTGFFGSFARGRWVESRQRIHPHVPKPTIPGLKLQFSLWLHITRVLYLTINFVQGITLPLTELYLHEYHSAVDEIVRKQQ